MADNFYVYVHKKQDTGEVFYVGKGNRGRATRLDSRSPHWLSIVARHGFTVDFIKKGLPEACALTLERLAIAGYGRDRLCNKTDGGGGSWGYLHDPKTIAKMSERRKGIKAITAPEVEQARREKLRQARLGKTTSQAHKEACRRAQLGKRQTLESRAKKAAAVTGVKHPRYDPTIRRFVHPVAGAMEADRYEFMEVAGVSRSAVSLFLSGQLKTCKGWSLAI